MRTRVLCIKQVGFSFLLLFMLGSFDPLSARDTSSLDIKRQKGAELFINYCSGCHTLRYMPYQRMTADLGLPHVNRSQSVRLESVSMPKNEASRWFGKVPPDLSLTARERGESWVYAYLTSFYSDKQRPFGANNLVVPDAAMPNVLAPLQGEVKKSSVCTQLTLETPGLLSPGAFDADIQAIVAFLAYVAEPALLIRYKIGVAVIVFLCFLLLINYLIFRSLRRK